MRDHYHEQLESVGRDIAATAALAGRALSLATRALLDADPRAAEAVAAADRSGTALRRELEARTLDLMARQQPVAGDLRVLVTALRMSADLERMGGLATHVAEIARMRHPECAVPEELRATFERMGAIAADLAERVGRIVEDRDVEAARRLEAEDDAVDRLHRAVFTELLARDGSYPAGAAIDVTLLSRYYERFADHAVLVARHLLFLVNGDEGGPAPLAPTGGDRVPQAA
ncbi:MAG TPA: phosphate signaling complex protein PhoU [Actinospica sp.]|nr:phosphate signaling complex protein PhoU [Actinospica sp.]